METCPNVFTMFSPDQLSSNVSNRFEIVLIPKPYSSHIHTFGNKFGVYWVVFVSCVRYNDKRLIYVPVIEGDWGQVLNISGTGGGSHGYSR